MVDVQKEEAYKFDTKNQTQVLTSEKNFDIDKTYLQKTFSHPASLMTPLVSRCVLNFLPQGQEIESKIWYFGELSKATAENWLSNAPIGTFLFRFGSQQRYVLSLKTATGPVHVLLGSRYYKQSVSNILGTNRFETLEEYIEHFHRNSIKELYNTTLNFALIRTKFRANFAFVISTTEENFQVRPGDVITVVDTSQEKSGFWQVIIDEKALNLPWALISKYCDSILIEEASTSSCIEKIISHSGVYSGQPITQKSNQLAVDFQESKYFPSDEEWQKLKKDDIKGLEEEMMKVQIKEKVGKDDDQAGQKDIKSDDSVCVEKETTCGPMTAKYAGSSYQYESIPPVHQSQNQLPLSYNSTNLIMREDDQRSNPPNKKICTCYESYCACGCEHTNEGGNCTCNCLECKNVLRLFNTDLSDLTPSIFSNPSHPSNYGLVYYQQNNTSSAEDTNYNYHKNELLPPNEYSQYQTNYIQPTFSPSENADPNQSSCTPYHSYSYSIFTPDPNQPTSSNQQLFVQNYPQHSSSYMLTDNPQYLNQKSVPRFPYNQDLYQAPLNKQLVQHKVILHQNQQAQHPSTSKVGKVRLYNIIDLLSDPSREKASFDPENYEKKKSGRPPLKCNKIEKDKKLLFAIRHNAFRTQEERALQAIANIEFNCKNDCEKVLYTMELYMDKCCEFRVDKKNNKIKFKKVI